MKVETDIEHPGHEALHRKLRPEPAVDQIPQHLRVFEIDSGRIDTLQPALLQLDNDRNLDPARYHLRRALRSVYVEQNPRDRADLDAFELHGRADSKAVHVAL